MDNNTEQVQQEAEIILSKKEKVLEFIASAICFLLLLASFLKVVVL